MPVPVVVAAVVAVPVAAVAAAELALAAGPGVVPLATGFAADFEIGFDM